jgi:hypothetical protein
VIVVRAGDSGAEHAALLAASALLLFAAAAGGLAVGILGRRLTRAA